MIWPLWDHSPFWTYYYCRELYQFTNTFGLEAEHGIIGPSDADFGAFYGHLAVSDGVTEAYYGISYADISA